MKNDLEPLVLRPRRHLLTAIAAGLLLAACGGGGAPDAGSKTPSAPGGNPPPPVSEPGPHAPLPGPQITAFEASAAQIFVGETLTLRAAFSGGTGRIEPGLGAVSADVDISAGPLDRDQTYRLVVSAAGAADVERERSVRVVYRDEYVNLALPFAAFGHAAVAAADGSVLLLGGSRGAGETADRIDRYEPRSGNILFAGRLLTPRVSPTATRLADGMLLVLGGSLDPQQATAAELVDERSGQSVPAGHLSVQRTDLAAIALGGGRVLVTGGVASGEGEGLAISASAEIWEPGTRRFRRLGSRMNIPRSGHTMTLLADGRILIAGGYSSAPQPMLAEIFDPQHERFTPVLSTWPMRAGHAALNTPDGKVLLLGGEQWSAAGEEATATASVLRYDPADGLLRPMAPLAVPRSLVQALMLPGGQALLFGGQQSDGHVLRSAERYDMQGGGAPIRALDGPRIQHTVTRLSSGYLAVIGGRDASGGFASALQLYR